MQEPRRHLLAGTGRTGDEQAAARIRDPLKGGPDLVDGARIARKLVGRDEAFAQAGILAA